jgi:cytochrome P450 family 12
MYEEYGDLVKFGGVFGQRDMMFTFDPNDIERIYRSEGKFPKRHGLDTLEYFRGTYRRDWFEKGTGLVPSQGQDWHNFRTKGIIDDAMVGIDV